MACTPTVEVCQSADAKRQRGFNWTLEFARRWAPNMAYADEVAIRPSSERLHTGFEYVSDGGQSNGRREPQWPATAAETVEDGSILWTAQYVTFGSLIERIASSTWSGPDDITIDDEEITDEPGAQITSCSITGGTPGSEVEIVNEVVTTEGNRYIAKLLVTIE